MFSLKALTNTAQQGMWQLGAVCRARAHRQAGTWKHSSLWKGQSKLSQDAPGSAFHWPGTRVWPGLSKKRRGGLLSYIQKFMALMRWMKWWTMSTDFQRADASQPFIYGPSRLTTMAPYTNLCSQLVSWPLRALPPAGLCPGHSSHQDWLFTFPKPILIKVLSHWRVCRTLQLTELSPFLPRYLCTDLMLFCAQHCI